MDKSLGKVLPEILQNTFLEDIVNDEVSMSHPYGAAAVPYMAEQAGIYHTNPQFVYLDKQPALDTFNADFADKLYLFEQRLSGGWKEADNLGNFTKYISTYELLDTLRNNNAYKVDQRLYIKSRLFDMLIGDWDRHEDQWEWGLKEIDGRKIYQAVPQDRDQAFFKYDGKLLKLLISAAGLNYFQAFDHKLPDVNNFNYEERNLDRFFTNEMALQEWESIARDLQRSLSDDVIERSVKQLPSEIFAISGNEIIAKLKSRRKELLQYATTYYQFISKEVEIVGSKGDELFQVSRLNDNETSVEMFSKSNKESPSYARVFKTDETKEIRIYGLSGNDKFILSGAVKKGIKIRIIGGTERDSVINNSVVRNDRSKTEVYDNADNFILPSIATKLHISEDTAIHGYKYFSYLYDKKGISPIISFNYEDRLHAGLNYRMIHHKWRALPFAYKQGLSLNYSFSQHAISLKYQGVFPKAVGKWDLLIDGNFDAIRWTKFFGLGNETPLLSTYNDFYRMRSREWTASIGINKKHNHNNITLNGFLHSIKIINDPGRFVLKNYAPLHPVDYSANNFVGARVSYIYDHVNDTILPTRGFTFLGSASYNNNITTQGRNFGKVQATGQVYVPIIKHLSLSVKASATTLSGDPLFYQYANIGGPETLRGYRLERFWGKTAFYNANELRYIRKIKSYVFNGKIGVLALYDNGRVWLPGEQSNTWHNAYGGGVLISPFNKFLIVVTYAKSPEMKLFQLRVGRTF